MALSKRSEGLLVAILSSSTFGLIPLFTLPLTAAGVSFKSVLFFRFFFAALFFMVLLKARRNAITINRREFPPLALLGLLYFGSAFFLFWAYAYMASGVATTIHFLYPLFVMLIMSIFFKERLRALPSLAIAMAIVGVALLMGLIGSSTKVAFWPFVIVCISAISFALYIVYVGKSTVRNMLGAKLSAYVMLMAAAFSLLYALISDGRIYFPQDLASWINVLLLALLPTVVSNLALVYAARRIGSTLVSALGAMEPLTSVIIGVLVFGENLKSSGAMGIAMILLSVCLLVYAPQLERYLSNRFFHRKKA